MRQSKVRQRERIEGRFETHWARWGPVVLLALLAPLTHGLTLLPVLVCSMQLFTCKQRVTDQRVLYSVGYFWCRVQQLPLAEVTAELYAAMAKRNAELAAGGPAVTFVDQTLHMQDEGWRAVMGVNLDGAFWGCRAAIRLMAQDGHGGSLINISSSSAQSGEGPVHYVTSKAALIGLTRGLAREVAARGIRVNTVAPGPTDTPLMRGIPQEWISSLEKAIPLGRLGRPDEVAAAVAFLASDESSFITGSTLTVNGGSYFL